MLLEDTVARKLQITIEGALVYYEHLLSQDGLITEKSSAIISEESMLLAEDLYKYTLEILSDKKFVRDDE